MDSRFLSSRYRVSVVIKIERVPCDIISLGFVDVSDDALDLGVEKLFVALIELGDADTFFLADVKLLLQRLVFCHWDCGVERSRIAVW